MESASKIVMRNRIAEVLCEWGVCDRNQMEVFYPRVRDRDDVSILKCMKSGVLFTSTSEYMNISHYSEKHEYPHYWKEDNRKRALVDSFSDDSRRRNQFLSMISNKNWMDIGTGAGGILDQLGSFAAKVVAVEPQQRALEALKREQYDAYGDIADVAFKEFDVITLFHVFEHLTDPQAILQTAYDKLKVGGKIVIEVPHARDFLITHLDLEEFKQFTFWSEHLVLHNRTSLTTFLQKSNFKNIIISGFQRYNLANHLHWMRKKMPGGHIHWNMLSTDGLDREYANMLERTDMTDTLIAIAEK